MSEKEWKTTREFEGVLREKSRVETIYQNEEKLNPARTPAMRKAMHDSLPRDAMSMKDFDNWSSNEERTHPTKSDAKVELYVVTGT